jgi:hypothetical protein
MSNTPENATIRETRSGWRNPKFVAWYAPNDAPYVTRS